MAEAQGHKRRKKQKKVLDSFKNTDSHFPYIHTRKRVRGNLSKAGSEKNQEAEMKGVKRGREQGENVYPLVVNS